jgi:hypothetical protein
MNYYFLIILVFLCSCSFVKYSVLNCADNDKMEFIEKLISEPDSCLSILKYSKYDKKETMYYNVNSHYYANYIKKFFSCGVEFYLIDYYSVDREVFNKPDYLVEVYIYKSKCNDKYLTFEFYSDDDSDYWHLNVIYYRYMNRAAGDQPEIADDCDDEES